MNKGKHGKSLRARSLLRHSQDGNAVGTTDRGAGLRGEEGPIFFSVKSKNFLAFRYARHLTGANGRDNFAI